MPRRDVEADDRRAQRKAAPVEESAAIGQRASCVSSDFPAIDAPITSASARAERCSLKSKSWATIGAYKSKSGARTRRR